MSDEKKPEFFIQRIYVQDSSFEAPGTPKAFLAQWKPTVNLNISTANSSLEDDIFEVVLTVTVKVENDGDTAFLVEVKQAGIFSIKHFPEDQHGGLLNSYCPTILFPYVRETISDIVARGGFPQLLLSPINFDALYQQQLKESKKAEKNNSDNE